MEYLEESISKRDTLYELTSLAGESAEPATAQNRAVKGIRGLRVIERASNLEISRDCSPMSSPRSSPISPIICRSCPCISCISLCLRFLLSSERVSSTLAADTFLQLRSLIIRVRQRLTHSDHPPTTSVKHHKLGKFKYAQRVPALEDVRLDKQAKIKR